VARLVNVTIPVECEDIEGLHKFMTAMAIAMNRLAHQLGPEFGVRVVDEVEGEELVPVETTPVKERDEV
jgi:hypothetical protein